MPRMRVLCTRSYGNIYDFEPIDGPESDETFEDVPGGRIPSGMLSLDGAIPGLYEEGRMYVVSTTPAPAAGDGIPRRRGVPLDFPGRLLKTLPAASGPSAGRAIALAAVVALAAAGAVAGTAAVRSSDDVAVQADGGIP